MGGGCASCLRGVLGGGLRRRDSSTCGFAAGRAAPFPCPGQHALLGELVTLTWSCGRPSSRQVGNAVGSAQWSCPLWSAISGWACSLADTLKGSSTRITVRRSWRRLSRRSRWSTPRALVSDAELLVGEFEDGWLRDQVVGLRTYAGGLAGESRSYADEVEGCYGVRPTHTREAVFAAAHERLAELLPGHQPLGERKAALQPRPFLRIGKQQRP
jgi:hypothetical protein